VPERACTATGRGKLAGEGDGGRKRGGRALGVSDLERPRSGFVTDAAFLVGLDPEEDRAPERACGFRFESGETVRLSSLTRSWSPSAAYDITLGWRAAAEPASNMAEELPKEVVSNELK
jgi:hypothetical protein